MKIVSYEVRVIKDGEVKIERTFKEWNKAEDLIERAAQRGRKVVVERQVKKDTFRIEPNHKWSIRPHDPWTKAAGPLETVFLHTSVTTQLKSTATADEERAQMRSVDSIAYGRGFNGFSYNFGVFPSGRAYEGRGFLVVEAATEDYNSTSDSIATIGNTDAFEPTEAQIQAIIGIIKKGQKLGFYAKKLNVREHNEVAAKACPGKFFTDAVIRKIERAVNE
jgi:hypothetical protein